MNPHLGRRRYPALVFLLIFCGLLTLWFAALPTTRAAPSGWPTLSLRRLAQGLNEPVHLTHAGDGSGRLFIVERAGRIWSLEQGELTLFLDITGRVQATSSEQGLLGLAFPPDFSQQERFYVNYTSRAAEGDTFISRFSLSDANRAVAEPASEEIILQVEQPATNHNGGQIAFGPADGYLYIGMGDGGGAGDPEGYGQRPDTWLGKLLRIDVATGEGAGYRVPADNPFVGREGYRGEIWALGLRNPWRFSFDRLTGELYIADVGQGAWEEINYQPATSRGGENYGWRCYEGNDSFNPSGCQDREHYTFPIESYGHGADGGCSVTGGYVYRGSRYPEMQGIYFYGDFCNGRIWGLRRGCGGWQSTLLLDSDISISTFGEDEAGNLYVADFGRGALYEIVQAESGAARGESCLYFPFLR